MTVAGDRAGGMVRRIGPALRARPELVLLLLGIVVQTGLVLYLARDTWFGHDAWHYLTRRGTIPEADVGLFAPWGGHWQVVPILVYRVLFAVFGLASFVPYLMVSLVLHATICLLLYGILVRVGASSVVAAVAAWLVLFFGGGAEAFVSDAPIPLTMALACGLGAVLLSLSPEPSRKPRIAATVLLVVGVMSSGVGLVSLFLVALLTATRQGLLRAAHLVWPAALTFVVWFIAIGREGDRIQLSGWDYADIPSFVWTGLTTALGNASGVPGSGGVLVIALVAVSLLIRSVPDPLRQLAWVGMLSAVVQMSLGAVASLHLGMAGATQPRYQYLAFVLMTPAVALGLTALASAVQQAVPSTTLALPVPLLMAGVLLVACTVQGIELEKKFTDFDAALTSAYRTWALGSLAAVRDGEEVLTPHPTALFSEDVDVRLLTAPVMAEQLVDEPVSDQQRLDAENQFFTYVGADDPDMFEEAFIRSEGFTTGNEAGPGCHNYTAQLLSDPVIELSVGQGNAFGVTSESTSVTTQLVRDGVESTPQTWTVEEGQVYLASTARDAVLRASFNGDGDFTVCHN